MGWCTVRLGKTNIRCFHVVYPKEQQERKVSARRVVVITVVPESYSMIDFSTCLRSAPMCVGSSRLAQLESSDRCLRMSSMKGRSDGSLSQLRSIIP